MITELLIYGALMFMLGYWVARWIEAAPREFRYDLKSTDEKPGDDITMLYTDAKVIDEEREGFAVAGRRRKPTFRERRRALELGSRTQREKQEEWRD